MNKQVKPFYMKVDCTTTPIVIDHLLKLGYPFYSIASKDDVLQHNYLTFYGSKEEPEVNMNIAYTFAISAELSRLLTELTFDKFRELYMKKNIASFKMRVNPTQSEIVQRVLFENGYKWNNGKCSIQATIEPFLYLRNGRLTYGNIDNSFNKDSLDELTFERFENLYMDKKYELTKDQILEMSKTSKEVEVAFRKLYPEVFRDIDKYFDLGQFPQYPFGDLPCEKAGFHSSSVIQVRTTGEFAYKAFYLQDVYDWELKKDSNGCLCLIPTKR